jgi:DNA-binding response OmpR family regulator
MSEAAHTVMVVEDDADVMFTITQRLNNSGFRCIPAPDGLSALVVGRQRNISAAVVDVNLPIGNGFEVAQALLESNAEVIMITASRDPALRHRAAQLGCCGFVQKPFTGTFLVAQLKQALHMD